MRLAIKNPMVPSRTDLERVRGEAEDLVETDAESNGVGPPAQTVGLDNGCNKITNLGQLRKRKPTWVFAQGEAGVVRLGWQQGTTG